MKNQEGRRKESRQERIDNEKQLLLAKLVANNFKEIRPRVAFLLNYHPETRNSDIFLHLNIGKSFSLNIFWTMG